MQSGSQRLIALAMLVMSITHFPMSEAITPDVVKEEGYEVVRIFNEETEIEEENSFYEMIAQEEKAMADNPENFETWVKANQNVTFTVYNKTVDDTTLVRLDSEGNSKIFAVQGITGGGITDWKEVGKVSATDIIHIAYTVYWEVGGQNPESVSAQIQVIANRMQMAQSSVEEVLSAKNQYSSWGRAKARKLKSNSEIEKEDLKKVFKYALNYLACQTINMPENVIYAALFPQGSGTWKVIDGTYYCYR